MSDDQQAREAVEAMAAFISFRQYNFLDWYWLADDGRIWGSKRRAALTADDPDYVAWLEGGPPSPWPRDNAGNQTDEALTAVLESYDIKVGGVPINGTARAFKVVSK